MKIKEFDIILNIKEPTNQGEFEVVQGDSGSNLLRVTLINGLEQYDLTGTNVEIVFRKADGTTVQQTDTSIISRTGGRFQVILKTNTIACPGPVTAEVRILEEEILLTSTRFNFFVRKSLINDETIESTNEFPVLTQLVIDTKEIIEAIPAIETKLGEITNTESNLNQSITVGNTLKTDLYTTIGEGNTLKTGLDNSIADGNVLKENLDDIIAGTDYEHVLTELSNKLDKTGDSKDNIVTFTETDGELSSGSNHATLFGIIKKKFADILTSLAGKIDKTSIAQTTEVNDPNRVPSTVVTNGLQQSFNMLNNNLANNLANLKIRKIVATVAPDSDGVITFTHNCNFSNTEYVAIINPVGNGHIYTKHAMIDGNIMQFSAYTDDGTLITSANSGSFFVRCVLFGE